MPHKYLSTPSYVITGAAVLVIYCLYKCHERKEFVPMTSLTNDQEPHGIHKDGRFVVNPWHFFSVKEALTEDKQLVTSLLQQTYAAPPTQQEFLAQQLALQNQTHAHQLWFEAFVTGHEMVASAIVQGGKVALQGSDMGRNVENSIQTYMDSVRQEIWQATGDQQRQLVEKFCDGHRAEASQLMFNAAVKGHPKVIEILVELKIPIHLEEDPSLMPFHAACFNGNLECAKVLHSSGVSIDHQDEFGGTPLMRAATAGHLGIVQWLLDNGADVNLQDFSEQKMNALVNAAWDGREDVFILLRKHGGELTSYLLAAAAHGGNVEIYEGVKELAGLPRLPSSMKDMPLTSFQREQLLSALEYSGHGSSVPIIQDILEFLMPVHRSLVEEISSNHRTITDALFKALQDSAGKDSVETADFILRFAQQRLTGDADDQIATTALQDQVNHLMMSCADKGSLKLARYLLEKQNADTDLLSPPHYTAALHHAANAGHVELVELLVTEHNANIHQGSGRFANGPTALWTAVSAKREWVVRRLLDLGGPVEAIDTRLERSLTRCYIAASKNYRAPVTLTSDILPSWLQENSPVRFMCLEYPDGLTFLEKLQFRKSDEELKDERELRSPE